MAVLEFNDLNKYVNGLHKLLASLKKDEASETYTFAKVYINEEDVVVLLNAELTDFAETGINVDPSLEGKNEETKVGVNVFDEASYENAVKAIELVANKFGLVADAELEVPEVNPLDYLYHDGETSIKSIVYKPTTKTITVKVPYTRDVVVTRMVPLTFTQKLVMVGANDKEKEDHNRVRAHFDSLMNVFMEKKVNYRVTKKCVKISYKRETLAKMVIVGKRTIKVYLSLNRFAYDDKYRIVDASDRTSYVDVPACVKVTGKVSLNRCIELVKDVLANYEVPANKKFVPNYSYSKDIINDYMKSLEEPVEVVSE